MINDPSLVARSALAIGLVRRFDFLDDERRRLRVKVKGGALAQAM